VTFATPRSAVLDPFQYALGPTSAAKPFFRDFARVFDEQPGSRAERSVLQGNDSD
jgi:hypothetical protein